MMFIDSRSIPLLQIVILSKRVLWESDLSDFEEKQIFTFCFSWNLNQLQYSEWRERAKKRKNAKIKKKLVATLSIVVFPL